MIRITDVMDGDLCETLCYMEADCVSYNLQKARSGNGKHKCELNNSTHEGHEDELKENTNYVYRGAEASVIFNKYNLGKLRRGD